MKILYDHQIFALQSYGGISRYFCELMNQFSKDPAMEFILPVGYSTNEYLKTTAISKNYWFIKHNYPHLNRFVDLLQKNVRYSVIDFFLRNQKKSELMLKQQDFDIFHPTYYNPYFLKYLKTKPYVLTVYDMIHELYPDMFKGDTTAIQKRQVIEGAAKIIAISGNTKTDIIRFYDIDPQKIEVIPLATSLQINKPDTALNLPQKYILFVGNRGGYKNFISFVNSISSLLREENDLFLVCAGGGAFSENEILLLDDLKIKMKVLYYPIANDSTLLQFYRKAILFVFPSLYEGFGIPVLEAFSCGCPVAASNCSSLPEVGGESAHYFDPKNSASIRKVVEDIVHNYSLQDSLRARGYERLKLFSWEKTAFNTKKVYESLLSQ
jgi:glycosyltransferase involved in cell wall biosynthesis